MRNKGEHKTSRFKIEAFSPTEEGGDSVTNRRLLLQRNIDLFIVTCHIMAQHTTEAGRQGMCASASLSSPSGGSWFLNLDLAPCISLPFTRARNLRVILAPLYK